MFVVETVVCKALSVMDSHKTMLIQIHLLSLLSLPCSSKLILMLWNNNWDIKIVIRYSIGSAIAITT
jgi:hypothetical protein